jgi:hypothetical protein
MIFLLIIFSLLGAKVIGSPVYDRDDVRESILDSTKSTLTNSINTLANRIDSFFATERADDELGRSRIRISQTYNLREREMPVTQTRYRFNLKLPNLEAQFKLDPKSKDKNRLKGEKNKNELIKINNNPTGWILNADAGVSIAIPPRLNLRTRLRNNFYLGPIAHRFAESLSYTTDEIGLEEETNLQSDLRLSDILLFRFNNIKTWNLQNEIFTTSHGPSLIQSLGNKEAMSYNFSINNEVIEKVFFTSSYTFSVNYRKNVYNEWIYFDFIPGIDFPKKWSFRRTPFINTRLEVLF